MSASLVERPYQCKGGTLGDKVQSVGPSTCPSSRGCTLLRKGRNQELSDNFLRDQLLRSTPSFSVPRDISTSPSKPVFPTDYSSTPPTSSPKRPQSGAESGVSNTSVDESSKGKDASLSSPTTPCHSPTLETSSIQHEDGGGSAASTLGNLLRSQSSTSRSFDLDSSCEIVPAATSLSYIPDDMVEIATNKVLSTQKISASSNRIEGSAVEVVDLSVGASRGKKKIKNANIREKMRVRSINSLFSELKALIPKCQSEKFGQKKLAKARILVKAYNYINELEKHLSTGKQLLAILNENRSSHSLETGDSPIGHINLQAAPLPGKEIELCSAGSGVCNTSDASGEQESSSSKIDSDNGTTDLAYDMTMLDDSAVHLSFDSSFSLWPESVEDDGAASTGTFSSNAGEQHMSCYDLDSFSPHAMASCSGDSACTQLSMYTSTGASALGDPSLPTGPSLDSFDLPDDNTFLYDLSDLEQSFTAGQLDDSSLVEEMAATGQPLHVVITDSIMDPDLLGCLDMDFPDEPSLSSVQRAVDLLNSESNLNADLWPDD